MRTTLTRFDPIRDIAALQGEMERTLRESLGADGPSTAGAFAPALDVEEDADGFTLLVDLPGVSPELVDVSLEESVLTISGERAAPENNDNLRRAERRFGRFHRAVRLPDRVDGDRVSASYRDGVLRVEVPKAEEAKPRRIAVSVD